MPEKGMKKLVETKPKKVVEQDTDDDMFNMDSMMNMMMMAMMVTIMIQLSPIGRNMGSMSQDIHTYVTGQQTMGKQEPKELIADPMLRVYQVNAGMPWTSAVIYNWGSYPVKIGFNSSDQMFQVDPGQIYNASRTGSSMRIIAVYYQCLPAQSTTVRLTGEY